MDASKCCQRFLCFVSYYYLWIKWKIVEFWISFCIHHLNKFWIFQLKCQNLKFFQPKVEIPFILLNIYSCHVCFYLDIWYICSHQIFQWVYRYVKKINSMFEVKCEFIILKFSTVMDFVLKIWWCNQFRNSSDICAFTE